MIETGCWWIGKGPHRTRAVSSIFSSQDLVMLSNTSILEFRRDVYDFLRKEWCNEELISRQGVETCEAQFIALLKILALPPLVTTLRLNTNVSPAQNIIQQLEPILIEQYKKKGRSPPELKIHPEMCDALLIENYGPNVIEMTGKEVMVGLACGMAVLRGADVYAQGVMAAPSDMEVGALVSVFADVEGKICKGLTRSFEGAKFFVGNGLVEMSRSQIFCSGNAKQSGLAVRMVAPVYTAPSLSGVLPSVVFPQNLPSICCVHALDPQPGHTVLDMCAAPGGKTTHIATLMKDQGVVIALDKSKNKISRIEQNATLWDLKCIHAFAYNATKAVSSNVPVSAALPHSPPYSPATFDSILLDAPCSALGQRPAIRNAMKLSEVTSYPPLQRKLFTAAVELLKPGGALVYSTCTFTLDENEGVVVWALKTFPCLQLIKQKPHLGGPGMAGRGLPAHQLALLQRFDPSNPQGGGPVAADTGTIGFFSAKFVKS